MNMMRSYFRTQSAGVLLLALAGCANLSGIEPGATMLVPHSLAAGSQPDTAIFPQQHWWQSFDDDQLDALISRAIAKNHSLKVVQSP